MMNKDTLIIMENGEEKKVSKIRPGHSVLAYKNGKFSPSTVLGAIGPAFTENHLILTNKGWTKASDLFSQD